MEKGLKLTPTPSVDAQVADMREQGRGNSVAVFSSSLLQ